MSREPLRSMGWDNCCSPPISRIRLRVQRVRVGRFLMRRCGHEMLDEAMRLTPPFAVILQAECDGQRDVQFPGRVSP